MADVEENAEMAEATRGDEEMKEAEGGDDVVEENEEAKGAAEAEAEEGGADAADAADAGDAAEEEKPPEEEQQPPEEDSKELEEDAAEDSRPALGSGIITIDAGSASLNCMPSCGGRVLLALSDGGFQYLSAAARANTGIRAGRYFYEVRPIEGVRSNPGQQSQQGNRSAQPRQQFTFGFSTGAQGNLFIGYGEGSAGFDSDGNMWQDGTRTRVIKERNFAEKYKVFGVLLNLDPASPNANTVSLFRDGVRMCKPQALPETMKGKVLYPTVNYKNFTLHLNWGPEPCMPLPFKCRMLEGAAEKDVETIPKSGAAEQEVIFPVGLPDEGTFDWLDGFLEENPQHIELSDRALLRWCEKSNISRPKGYEAKNSNDRPGMEFGIRELDDGSTRKLAQYTVSMLKRNCVYMEVRNNLMASERQKGLELFNSPGTKRVAVVVMGEPPAKFKAAACEALLKEKRAKVESDVRKAKAVEDRKKKAEKGEKKKDAEGDGQEKQEEEPEESLEDAIKKAVDAVELTSEEKQRWFFKREVEDLNRKELAKQYANFSIPTKEEGFDEIRFAWQPLEGSEEHLKAWIGEKKLTMKVDELQPGTWFKDKWNDWQSQLQQWKKRHSQWKDQSRWPQRKDKAPEEPQRKRRKAEEEKTEDKEAEKTEEKKEGEDGEEAEGGEADKAEGEEKKKEPEDEEEEEQEPEKEKSKVNVEEVDVWTIEDVMDAANSGEPLFAHFEFEDWMLLTLRCELHLLVHGFRRDLDDADRPSFHESHLAFYYNKYFKKQFNIKQFGVNTNLELIELVKDAVEASPKTSILEAMLSDDTPFDNFIKLTEDGRRERQRTMDAGDEAARLKFTRPSGADGMKSSGGSGGGAGGKGYGSTRSQNSGKSNTSYGSSRDSGRSQNSGYGRPDSRAPLPPPSTPPPPHSRGPPPGHHMDSRMPPPPRHDMRQGYGDPRHGGGHYGGGHDRGGGHHGGSRGGYGSGYAAPPPPAPSRGGGGGGYGSMPPPPSRGYGHPPPAPSSAARGYGHPPPPPSRGDRRDDGGHKRSYGHDDGRSGHGSAHKQARGSSSYGGGGAPSSRGGHSSSGGYGRR